MYDAHRDVTDEDIGIRAFQIKKEKAAERAIERLRHGLGQSWGSLTPEEVDELDWVFGELWAYVSRDKWDDLQFGHLDVTDVIKILTLGSQMRRHARGSIEILKDVDAIVTAKSGPAAADSLIPDAEF